MIPKLLKLLYLNASTSNAFKYCIIMLKGALKLNLVSNFCIAIKMRYFSLSLQGCPYVFVCLLAIIEDWIPCRTNASWMLGLCTALKMAADVAGIDSAFELLLEFRYQYFLKYFFALYDLTENLTDDTLIKLLIFKLKGPYRHWRKFASESRHFCVRV